VRDLLLCAKDLFVAARKGFASLYREREIQRVSIRRALSHDAAAIGAARRAWRGLTGKRMGHVVLPREMAQELVEGALVDRQIS
jgi:hypothetical protein